LGPRSKFETPLNEEILEMINMLKDLHNDESGQDLIEYGLIALIVALGALAGMGKLSKSINGLYSAIAGSLT